MYSLTPMAHDPLEILSNLTPRESRLRFYTIQTRHEIPSTPGCYAWFVPLWIYEDDLDKQAKTVSEILHYEYRPEIRQHAQFTWKTVQIDVRHTSRSRNTDAMRETWKSLLSEPDAQSELEEMLMAATLLMPPLYVGRTNNLNRRYQEHTDPSRKDKNDFRARFSEHMQKLKVRLSVSDLIFACIHTPPRLTTALDKFDPDNIEELIERLLMQFCQPPFSLK